MYYKRFCRSDIDSKLSIEIITHDQYRQILNVFDNDIFLIRGREGVDVLQSVIPDCTQMDHDADRDLYYIHVDTWPHLKDMCLKYAPKKPYWIKYVDEEGDDLFEYHLDTYSIFRPSTVLSIDSANTSRHGID